MFPRAQEFAAERTVLVTLGHANDLAASATLHERVRLSVLMAQSCSQRNSGHKEDALEAGGWVDLGCGAQISNRSAHRARSGDASKRWVM